MLKSNFYFGNLYLNDHDEKKNSIKCQFEYLKHLNDING